MNIQELDGALIQQQGLLRKRQLEALLTKESETTSKTDVRHGESKEFVTFNKNSDGDSRRDQYGE